MSKPLTVRLPDDLDQWLREQSALTGLTRTAIVVAALTAVRFGSLTWAIERR